MAKMKLLFSSCFFICLASAEEYHETIPMGKGIPVPHADFLERVIKKSLFPNKTADQSFLDLYGDVSDLDNATLARLQTLEFSVLDVDNVKLYTKLARRCMERSQVLGLNQTSGRRKIVDAFNRYDGHMMKALMSMMQQSVLNSRLMLQRTNPLRARYRSDVSFNIGQLYGTLLELKTKGARVLSTMIKFDAPVYVEVKFYWYLLLYARVLQIHTDARNAAERIFVMNRMGIKAVINENPAGDAHRAEEKKRKHKLAG